jgi:protein O-GlcNAc transferase
MAVSAIADLLADALAMHRRGAVAEAAARYAEVLRADPDNADAHFYLAMISCQHGRFEEGIALARKSLTDDPRDARAHVLVGRALTALGRHAEALTSLDRALALAPDVAQAHGHRGDVLSEISRYAEAVESYDRALALAPDAVEDWLNRGLALIGIGRYHDAVSSFDRAIGGRPGFPDLAEAWTGRGQALTELKLYDDAFEAFDKAMELKPDLKYAAGTRLLAKLQICDWKNLDGEVAKLLAAIRQGRSSSAPFTMLAIPSSAGDQLQCARRYVQDQPAFAPIWRGEVYSHDRIRVAYLSADFREHPVPYLLAGMFERHDKSRFETTAISFAPGYNSPMRLRLQGAFEHFIDAEHMSDRDIAELVRRLEIDIAVDLMGFTKNNRLNVMARRPAPIQANYMGYPGTMGASYIDYIIADPTVIPEDQCAFYSEQVVWVPESYFVNDNRRAISEHTPTRRDCALPETGFVFCCFNNNYKIAPEMFDIWMRLLRATENSVLWLLEDNATASANLRREAERRGVASRRLIFAARASPADHLARLRLADLVLDTLPYNAHTTACDALWVGVPVLSCPGETFVGRVAASLLKAGGLDELIVHALEEYEALALKLAYDPSTLASVKQRVADSRERGALFDTERSTRYFESAYLMMWERYQRGEMPKARPGGSKPIRIA